MTDTMIEPHHTSQLEKPRRPGGDRLVFLDEMRGLAIIGVVWIHASSYANHHGFSSPLALGLEKLFVCSVPVFFAVDGFLFGRTVSRPGAFRYRDYLRKSALRLLVPWVLFAVFYAIARASFEAIGFFPVKLLVGQSFRGVLSAFWYSTYAPQMYFLPALFLIRSLAFLTRRIVLGGWPWGVAIAVGSFVALRSLGLRLESDPVSQACFGLRFFLVGIACYQLDGFLRRYAWETALIAILLFTGTQITVAWRPSSTWMWNITLVLAIVTQFAFFMWQQERLRPAAWLGRRTMDIYLLHFPVVMNLVARPLARFVPGPFALRLAITAGSTVAALALASLISRFPHGRVLFGEVTAAARKHDPTTASMNRESVGSQPPSLPS